MDTCPQERHVHRIAMAFRQPGCDSRPMTVDAASPAATGESADADVDALVASLAPRLADAVGLPEVDQLVRAARADLGAVRVTTYLPILVERRVRQLVRAAQAGEVVDVREARVTA